MLPYSCFNFLIARYLIESKYLNTLNIRIEMQYFNEI